MNEKNTLAEKIKASNKTVDSDLRAALSVLHVCRAYINSRGITFEQYLAKLGKTTSTDREVLFTLHRCKSKGLVNVNNGRYRLTSSGQGYACPDTCDGGYSWDVSSKHKSLVYSLTKDGKLPKSMGER